MSFSQSKIVPTYTQEDIQQILQLAVARQDRDAEFSREQLLEIAAELQISPESLEIAEKEWLIYQGEQQKRKEFALYRRTRLKKSLGKYAIFNSFLMLLNLISSGGLSWSLYILLFWGLALGLNAWNTFQNDGEEYERAFQNWYRRHKIKVSINNFFDRLLKA